MEESIIAYIAKRRFKTENASIEVDEGDMISISEWESLSFYERAAFEPLTLNPIVEDASRVAESLSAHLDGVLKFNDRLSWNGAKAAYKELQRLMTLVNLVEL